jgi:hypothetical protein
LHHYQTWFNQNKKYCRISNAIERRWPATNLQPQRVLFLDEISHGGTGRLRSRALDSIPEAELRFSAASGWTMHSGKNAVHLLSGTLARPSRENQ